VVGPGPWEINYVVFGGLAIMVVFTTLDPWLCVAVFRRVCYFRFCYGRSVAQSPDFVLFIFVMRIYTRAHAKCSY